MDPIRSKISYADTTEKECGIGMSTGNGNHPPDFAEPRLHEMKSCKHIITVVGGPSMLHK